MAIVIESPKLLSVRITKLLPKTTKNNFVYTFDATIDVTAQLHSGTVGYNAGQYDGRDVKVGDYIATTGQGRVLKISEIKNVGPTRIECILIDEDQVNAAIDSTQFGESSIDVDDGILFELREGRPYLFPLPDILPGGLTDEFAIQIATRFNFVNKEKNINVEQLPHTFNVGETVTLSSSGWNSDTTEPTGVVVKADDDSFSVRLFGTKTYMELPGNVGDIYFWDPVDRILTTTPNSPNSVKLFQKLGSKEALLLDTTSSNAGGGSGSGFSGNYNDLINKPIIPNDISQLADASGLLQHITKTSELTNDSNFVTQTYVDTQIANVTNGGNIDLSGYATTTDVTNANTQTLANAKAYADGIAFSGDYNDLTNKPTIPDVTGLASTAYVDQQIAGIGTHFSGNYNDLTNKPTIPDVTGLASTAYVDQQVAGVSTFSGNYNDLTNKPTLFSGNYNELFNTPSIPTSTSDLINDSGFITSITSQQVINALGYTPQNLATAFNGDYNSLINKPSLTGFATETYVQTQLAGYQPTVDLTSYYTKTEVDSLITPHFSGSYNDLTDTPTIPSIAGLASIAYVDQQIANVSGGGSIDLSSYVTETELTTALAGYQTTIDLTSYYTKTEVDSLITPHFSGDYNDLQNKPTIPSLTGYATQTYVDNAIANISGGGNVDLTGYATQTYVQQQISAASLDTISSINDLNDVAIDGTETTNHVLMYNPLTNMWENTDLDETFATRDYVTQQVAQVVSGGQLDLSGYATESYVTQKLIERGDHFSGDYNDLVNRPILFSGNYNDLYNKPAGANDLEMQLIGSSLRLVDVATNPDTTISTVDLSTIASSLDYSQLTNLPTLFSGNYNDLVNRPTLFSGNYNDLANKPYIPSIAGLATEQYVNDKHAEPTIWGDKTFKGDVVFEQTTTTKTSTVDTTSEQKTLVMALQTDDAVETEALFSDGSRVEIAENSTAMFEAHIIGASSIGQYGVRIKGIVHRTSAGLILIGSTSKEILSEYGTWTANVSVENTNLKITVVGSDATIVDWTVFCEIISVKR